MSPFVCLGFSLCRRARRARLAPADSLIKPRIMLEKDRQCFLAVLRAVRTTRSRSYPRVIDRARNREFEIRNALRLRAVADQLALTMRRIILPRLRSTSWNATPSDVRPSSCSKPPTALPSPRPQLISCGKPISLTWGSSAGASSICRSCSTTSHAASWPGSCARP